jgi:uncharacterized protein YdiU (UPF0061 family)
MNLPSHPLPNPQGWNIESTYSKLPPAFFTLAVPTPAQAPTLTVFNHALAESIGLDFKQTPDTELAAIFSGNQLPPGAEPIAQAYAGHQFGHFTMLGDGRAHLIAEQLAPTGRRYDIQLKGSGQTPYSRQGDGRAALGPMLREYLMSEAMNALGIPTSRSLAVVLSGEPVLRKTMLPGAILTRVAASHLRVGTFEYAASRQNIDELRQLANYAIDRHYPEALEHESPYAALLNAVIARQAALVASWMHVGFIHGVMNTDNTTISGETIDYGPCAFMDQFSIDTVFSSIDRQGRYAFGNQAMITEWNLARLAESMLPLLNENLAKATDMAEAALSGYSVEFNRQWLLGMQKKLGLFAAEAKDLELCQGLLGWMQNNRADYTMTFRDLICDHMPPNSIYQSTEFKTWHECWQARLSRQTNTRESSLSLMRKSNPVVIPRNHLVEAALSSAEQGDLQPFITLLGILQHPFDDSDKNIPFRDPPKECNIHYQTFCGT